MGQHKISLLFKDAALEKEFRIAYEEEIRGPLRFGILISIMSWLSSLILVYSVIPEKFYSLSITTIVVIVPFFLFIIYATGKSRFKGWIHVLGTMSNAWAGLFAIYFCNQFPNGSSFTLPVLIFIVFFGSYMVRLRWMAGFIAAFLYIAAFHVYMQYYTDMDFANVSMNAFVGWLTLIFALLAGHFTESHSRIRFEQKKIIREQGEEIRKEKEESEKLLLNILPLKVAEELKAEGKSKARKFENVSVFFSDIVGFTNIASGLEPEDLVLLLEEYFRAVDEIIAKYGLEKIKTMGDAYMCVGGMPTEDPDSAKKMISASFEINAYIAEEKQRRIKLNEPYFELRIGIHTGPLVAGVVGTSKFAYDVWGDTVNIASRFETACEVGEINISATTKELAGDAFSYIPRGSIAIKNRDEMEMFYAKKK